MYVSLCIISCQTSLPHSHASVYRALVLQLEVSRAIVCKIRQRGGQFLFKLSDTPAFHDIGDTCARRKTTLKLQKAVTAWLKKILKHSPQEKVFVQEPPQHQKSSKTFPTNNRCVKESPKLDKMLVKSVAGILNNPPRLDLSEFMIDTRVAPPISIPSPLKDWNPKESPKLDKALFKTVAGILTIPPPLKAAPEFILSTSGVAPQIPIPSLSKDWNPRTSRVDDDKGPPEDQKPPSRCQEQEPYRLFVPPPQIPSESDLPDSSNRLEAADFQLQQTPSFQHHYQESVLLQPPQIATEGDLPGSGLAAFEEDRRHFSLPAASLLVSKLSTRPNSNNQLEPIDFQREYQRGYQEQLHRLLPPPQMLADDEDLPEIASSSFETTLGSNVSPAAASLPVSKLSTQSNSNNSLEPTDFSQNLVTQQHFTQHYQHDNGDAQDWFRAYDSR